MRRHRVHRKRIRTKIIIPKRLVVGIAAAALVACLAFLISQLFVTKTVKCQSQYGPCTEQIQSALNQAAGKYYFAAKSNVENILKNESSVKSYSIRLYNLHQVVVDVIERKAVAAIAKEGVLEEMFAVDEEGYTLYKTQSSNLPVLIIKTDDEATVGKQVSSEVLFGIKILRAVAFGYTVKLAYLEKDSISVGLPNGMGVLFPLEGDDEVLLGSLSLILSRLNTSNGSSKINEGGLLPKLIDLRFKNPVLK